MQIAALVVVVLGAGARLAHAERLPVTEDAGAAKTIVLADLGLHVVGAGVQRTVAPRIAIQGALEFYSPWVQNLNILGLRDDDVEGDVRGAAIRVRAFGYLGAAPTGWWISPFAQVGFGAGTRMGSSESGVVWATGAAVGYAWRFGAHVHLAIGGGIQYHVARISGGDTTPSFATLYPHLDANLGYAF